jgi:hypothetical protein
MDEVTVSDKHSSLLTVQITILFRKAPVSDKHSSLQHNSANLKNLQKDSTSLPCLQKIRQGLK